jgi:hypothetical protein
VSWGIYNMRIDPTISCDSPSYDAWLPYVLFSIVAYPVGVPLGFACLRHAAPAGEQRYPRRYPPYPITLTPSLGGASPSRPAPSRRRPSLGCKIASSARATRPRWRRTRPAPRTPSDA